MQIHKKHTVKTETMSAAVAVNEIFELSIEKPIEETNGEGVPFQNRGRFGQFRLSKAFSVKRKSDGATKGIHGIVIQEIKKRSVITLETFFDASTRIVEEYTTRDGDARLNELTFNKVQDMWSEYFEIFVIIDGESFNVDSFENGPICTYSKVGKIVKSEVEDTYPPPTGGKGAGEFEFPYTYSFGSIEMVGRSRFFHMEAVPPVSTKKQQKELDNAIVDMLPPNIRALKVGDVEWYTGKETPANGLPYLPWAPAIAAFLETHGDSNLLTHTVRVRWGPDTRLFSIVESDPNFLESASGSASGGSGTSEGGARSRRLRPRTHKRKTHRKRRQ